MEKEEESIYNKGDYLENNPTWHEEDSPWKAKHIQQILERNNLKLQNICEIGCGVGEILNQLHINYNNDAKYVGYEVSTAAYERALTKANSHISFKEEDMLLPENKDFYDCLLCIDVFEHVDDYIGFISACKAKATYKIFHIPIELNALSMLKKSSFNNSRKQYGHLHYYSKETAISTLEYCGYEIIDHHYTNWAFELETGLKRGLINAPRKLLRAINQDMGVRLLGGSSLIVLAK